MRIFSPALCFVVVIGSAKSRADEPATPGSVHPIPEVLYIPTPNDIVVRMLELARVRKDDVLYDLGCGDGRILIIGVQKFGCRAVGFDIDPRRVKQSRENLKKNIVESQARVEEKDLFQVDLRPASVITLYLSPKFNARLIPQLEGLKPGSRIVSHQFDMEGIEAEQIHHYRSETDGRMHTLFLWRTPLKKIQKISPVKAR